MTVALVLAALVLALAVLEIATRLLNDVPVFAAVNFVVESICHLRTHPLNRYDETLGWCLKDNIYEPGGVLTTGTYGLRMNENKLRDPPQGAVLVVGDSFTAGSYVADSETYAAQLEKLIGSPVLNGASGGWGVDQVVLRAEQLIPVLKPKTVIVGILTADILRNTHDIFGAHKPWFTIENDKPVLHGVPVPWSTPKSFGLNKWQSALGYSHLVHSIMRRFAPSVWNVDPKSSYHKVLHDDFGVVISCALLNRLWSVAQEHGARLIAVILWGGDDAMKAPPLIYARLVADCARWRGIETLDMYETLQEIGVMDPDRYERLWVDEGDELYGHPSAEGHAIIARLLHEKFFS